MMSDKWVSLEAKAKASKVVEKDWINDETALEMLDEFHSHGHHSDNVVDAAFIAACSPTVVLKLIKAARHAD